MVPSQHLKQWLFAITVAICWSAGHRLSESGSTATAGELSESELRAAKLMDADSIVSAIDSHAKQLWADRKLTPSPSAAEGEWCRRLYLDVIGRIPTAEELAVHFKRRARGRRAELLEELLSDSYAEEFSRYRATYWSNLLIGRSEDTDGGRVSRPGMWQYLRDSFVANSSHGQIARELITATGTNMPGAEGFNGAVNFLTGKLSEGGVLATTKTSEVFLGARVQCTQCHNHPFNSRKHSEFWELNSFFRQARARRLDADRGAGVYLEDVDFLGESGAAPEAAEVYFEKRNGKLAAAWPKFVDGREPSSLSGRVDDINRREVLADFVLTHDDFDRAIVNRLWRHFLGYGFVNPVDDMGPHNPAVMPELLDLLGEQFRLHGRDTRKLVRWIVTSQPYALSSRTTRRNEQDDPTAGNPPAFSHFYLRQMGPEEFYRSLQVAIHGKAPEQSSSERSASEAAWLRQFARALGNDEAGETTSFNGTIPQALMMMNGELVAEATDLSQDNALSRLAADSSLNATDRIRRLYLAGLSRQPTSAEMAGANQLVTASAGNVAEALSDLWWAILNSNEFILNH